MFRYVFIAALAVFWQGTLADDEELYDLIQEIFNSESATASPQCESLEGQVKGCHECYSCEDARLAPFAKKRKINTVRMKDSNCERSRELCCVAQTDLILRSGDKCGEWNPEGRPRRRRPSLRALLPGQYPWIAWIYKKSSATPLCPATFVNENYKSFITLASCVDQLPADSLTVTFDKRFKTQLQVSKIAVHERFDKDRSHNNLAMVSVRSLEEAPEWSTPACLPTTRAEHATPCVTHTQHDKTVNEVVALRSACGNNSLHESISCAVAAPGDYAPQRGAGLYCLEQHVTSPALVVHGLALNTADDVTEFVDIQRLTRWLNSRLNL